MDNSLTVETVLSQREKYNLAFPFITEQQQINPYYKIIVSQYRVDISPESKDFCKIGSRYVENRWEDFYYLEKNFLERLAAAAGIQFPQPAGDVVKMDENTWKASAFGALRLPNGSELMTSSDFKVVDLVSEEKRYRLAYEEKAEKGITDYKAAKEASEKYAGMWVDTGARNEKGYPVKKYIIEESERGRYIEKSLLDAMTQLRASAPQKAMTGAKLRVIRSLLGLKNSYTMQELKKPFAVVRMAFSPDYNDPVVKQMMLQMCFQSVGSLFGNVQPVRQTISVQTPNAEEEEIVIENAVADTFIPKEGTGNQQEEQYSTEQPEPPQEGQRSGYFCHDCGAKINDRVYGYSTSKFGRPLCMKCQRGAGK